MEKYDKYNQKCSFFCIRLRKEKDDKYIKFLNDCPNRADLIRRAIDQELTK